MPLRMLRRSPLYCLTVTVFLALGIGAATLIFTALNAFVLRPLPGVRAERLARLGVEASATHVTFDHSSVFAQVLAGRARSFDAVFTFFPLDASFAAGRHVETLTCEVVSDNYFAALGLRPAEGAFFELGAGASLPAVLSYGLWQTVFGGRRDAIGSGVRVRGAAFVVAGVAPRGFGGLDLERRADIWVPEAAWTAWTGNPNVRHRPAQVLVAVRKGIALSQAEAEVRVLYPAMVDADLADVRNVSASDIARQKERPVVLAGAARGLSAMRRQFAAATPVLLGAIALLLALVVANAGGLLLARAEARRAETAVRLSLGASRWRILRATAAESFLLAGAGAVLGSAIAWFGGPLLAAFLPSRRPLNVDLHPDARVLAFAVLSTGCVALLAAVAPALRAAHTNIGEALGKGGNRVSAALFGRGMVALQVALAAVLVAGSAALVRSLDALRDQDPGFVREHLIVAALDPRIAAVKSEALPALFDEVLRRAGEIPGVAGASLAGYPFMRGAGFKNTMGPAGARLTPADRLNVSLNYVSETHLQNLGMRLAAGRWLSRADTQTHPTPVVVTESLARQFFPAVDPLGREFGPAGPGGLARPANRIVGVVRDIRYRGMRETAPPTFFAPFGEDNEFVTLHVRARADDQDVMRRIRALLAGVGPGLAPVSMATMTREIETSLWQERMLAALSQMFAAVALAVSGTGLFALLTFTLARRTREVGIRVAVGATRARIAALFALHTASAVAPGIGIGLAVFAAARRALAPLLFGRGAELEVPAAAGMLLLALAAVLAAAVPVLRATRIEPGAALRHE